MDVHRHLNVNSKEMDEVMALQGKCGPERQISGANHLFWSNRQAPSCICSTFTVMFSIKFALSYTEIMLSTCTVTIYIMFTLLHSRIGNFCKLGVEYPNLLPADVQDYTAISGSSISQMGRVKGHDSSQQLCSNVNNIVKNCTSQGCILYFIPNAFDEL